MQQARIYAAKVNRNIATKCFDADFGFASHVTEADKAAYRTEQLALAEAIEAGEQDHNLTVAQRMRYFLTEGECVALMPQ